VRSPSAAALDSQFDKLLKSFLWTLLVFAVIESEWSGFAVLDIWELGWSLRNTAGGALLSLESPPFAPCDIGELGFCTPTCIGNER
jgi:hypothetical protein